MANFELARGIKFGLKLGANRGGGSWEVKVCFHFNGVDWIREDVAMGGESFGDILVFLVMMKSRTEEEEGGQGHNN